MLSGNFNLIYLNGSPIVKLICYTSAPTTDVIRYSDTTDTAAANELYIFFMHILRDFFFLGSKNLCFLVSKICRVNVDVYFEASAFNVRLSRSNVHVVTLCRIVSVPLSLYCFQTKTFQLFIK